MKTIDTLRKDLTTERGLLSRLGDRQHAARLASEDADRAVEAAEKAFDLDQVASALEEKAPDAGLKKKLATLRAEAAAREGELTAIGKAQQIRAQNVATLEGELAIREFEALRQAFAPAAKKIYSAIDALVAAAAEADKILEATGPADLSEIFFPLRAVDGYFAEPKLAARNARTKMFFAALTASRQHVEYDPAKEASAA